MNADLPIRRPTGFGSLRDPTRAGGCAAGAAHLRLQPITPRKVFRIAARSDPRRRLRRRRGSGLPAALCVALLGLLLSIGATRGAAQGFAGLGTMAEGFALPDPARPLSFPVDHGAHPDFRIEWWYVTANLQGPDGTAYGVQWTLFRSALAPDSGKTGWATEQAFLAHAALTTPTTHRFAERLARGGIGQAGVTAQPFAAWIDEWQLAGKDMDDLRLQAGGADFAYDLRLRAQGPLVLHGDGGYSVKSADGQASRYYSQPFFTVTGSVTLPEGAIPVTGRAWLDREWSSQPLGPTQTGWDWVSLHLDGGAKLMAFRLRDTAAPAFTTGSWIAADGTVTPIPDGALRLTPLEQAEVAGRMLPVVWRVEVPERGVALQVAAINPDAMMETRFEYWEGPVTVSGSHSGVGYLEMTGY